MKGKKASHERNEGRKGITGSKEVREVKEGRKEETKEGRKEGIL